MVQQVTREYEVKDRVLKTYNGLVKQLWTKFSQIQLVQIPHEENTKANELSRVNSSDPKVIKGILVEVLNWPNTAEQKVMTIDALDWRSPITNYLKSPIAKIDSQSTKLWIRAARYIPSAFHIFDV